MDGLGDCHTEWSKSDREGDSVFIFYFLDIYQEVRLLALLSHSVMSNSLWPRGLYWSGLPFSSPEDLPSPRIKPRSSTLQADSLPVEPTGKPAIVGRYNNSAFNFLRNFCIFPTLCS